MAWELDNRIAEELKAKYKSLQDEGNLLSNATILYPTMEAEAREARIALHDPVYGSCRAHVVLRPVNLLQLDQLITGARKMKNERERTAFARWLAFGDD